jgi:hypothetical protein
MSFPVRAHYEIVRARVSWIRRVTFTVCQNVPSGFAAAGHGLQQRFRARIGRIQSETISLALSPDGSQLAFIATESSNHRNVWLRPLQSLDARLLPAEEGSTSVFCSPELWLTRVGR